MGGAGSRLNQRDVLHLLRRAAFCADKTDLEQLPGQTRRRAVEDLLDAEPSPAVGPSGDGRRRSDLETLQRWWLRRMLSREWRLHEKMVLFWHDHFPSSYDVGVRIDDLARQNATFRMYGLGPFRDLLHQVTRDPAMLRFLDGAISSKDAPNENYGRELMELFTLGPTDVRGFPNYTQDDVVAMARSLAGFRILREEGRSIVAHNHWDNGIKRLFADRQFETVGQLGVETPEGEQFPPDRNVIDLLFTHRDTSGRPTLAHFISRKLWAWFAYPDPDLGLVDELADAFVDSGYMIRDLVFAILTHDEFYSERARRSSAKNPVEFVLQAIWDLGVGTLMETLPRAMRRMGMELFNPPGVQGWTGGEAWLTTSQYLARVEFAEDLAVGTDGIVSYRFDPIRYFGETATTAAQVVDSLAARFELTLPDTTRRVLIDSVDEEDLGSNAWYERDFRRLVALFLTLPEFQVH